MTILNELEQSLSTMVGERLTAGQWTALMIVGGAALHPIQPWLAAYAFEDPDRKTLAVIVVRRNQEAASDVLTPEIP